MKKTAKTWEEFFNYMRMKSDNKALADEVRDALGKSNVVIRCEDDLLANTYRLGEVGGWLVFKDPKEIWEMKKRGEI